MELTGHIINNSCLEIVMVPSDTPTPPTLDMEMKIDESGLVGCGLLP